MTKKINLDIAEVEPREQRLGTIIGWDGTTEELAKAPGYEARGKVQRGSGRSAGSPCGGCDGCRLCELAGPFSQGSVCSEQMVECQAGHVRDAVLIQHAPVGCGSGQVEYNALYRNGLVMRGFPAENLRITNTNLKESDLVFGASDKLRQSINDVWERYQPKAIFIASSCATGIIGEDIESVAEEKEAELGIPVIPLACEGFRSKHWSTGFDATQHGILRQIVRAPQKKQEDLVNVINLWGSDVFTPMLAHLGLRVNYVVDLASVDELAQMSEAAATVGFCYTLSSYLAAALEQHFGVPEVKAPMPYGFHGTDAWLRELARVTHREERAEHYIASEHARVKPRIEELRKKLKGVKGFVATGSAYAHGLIEVLRELGIEVDGSLTFHHDPVYDSGSSAEDSLGHLNAQYGGVRHFHVSNRQQYQLYTFLQESQPDFLLIRHNGLAPLASRLGIPAAPLGDEHLAAGYQGMINIGETVLEILAHKKFHDDIKAHVKLPYTDWWRQQKDAYILARHPEILQQDEKEREVLSHA